MKATGIVRRIDDLGRVVIPKEIRRTMRIREGDPLEIYTDKDGEVIFKKYSPMGELAEFSEGICDSLFRTTEKTVAVCDRDTILSAAGPGRKELAERRISRELEQLMEQRSLYHFEAGARPVFLLDGSEKYTVSIAAPILSEGDVMGCVLFLSPGTPVPAGDIEVKLAHTVSGFLGKQLEC
jgi:AbrB family transcriptional regulator (stage V sporulation protein T)